MKGKESGEQEKREDAGKGPSAAGVAQLCRPAPARG